MLQKFFFMMFVLVAALSIMFYKTLFSVFSSVFNPAWQHRPAAEPIIWLITSTTDITPKFTQTQVSTPTGTALLSPTPPQPTPSPTITSEPAALALNTAIGQIENFYISQS